MVPSTMLWVSSCAALFIHGSTIFIVDRLAVCHDHRIGVHRFLNIEALHLWAIRQVDPLLEHIAAWYVDANG